MILRIYTRYISTLLICAIPLFLFACRHSIKIDSVPYNASVYVQEKSQNTQPQEYICYTPCTYTFLWYPFHQENLEIQLKGYRRMYLDADVSISTSVVIRDILGFRYKRLLGKTTRSTHTVLLIREHDGAGTWTAKDAQSN